MECKLLCQGSTYYHACMADEALDWPCCEQRRAFEQLERWRRSVIQSNALAYISAVDRWYLLPTEEQTPERLAELRRQYPDLPAYEEHEL